jgi:hypothetical protein
LGRRTHHHNNTFDGDLSCELGSRGIQNIVKEHRKKVYVQCEGNCGTRYVHYPYMFGSKSKADLNLETLYKRKSGPLSYLEYVQNAKNHR